MKIHDTKINDKDHPSRPNRRGGKCTILSVMNHIFNPKFRTYRYIIAILVSIIQGIFVLCIDYPVGLQTVIIQVMQIDIKQYNLIFSAYTWFDIGMSIAGSIMVDTFLGRRIGLILFTVVLLIGQLFISSGAYINNYPIMLIGRAILGSATGTTYSIMYNYQVAWFRGKEITFVTSISRSADRLMATLALTAPLLAYDSFNFIRSPIYRHAATQMIASCLCLFALGLSIIVALLDWYGASILKNDISDESLPEKTKMKLSDIKDFPLALWIIIFLCGLYYAVSIPSTANTPLFFISKYGYRVHEANLVNALSFSFIIIITPFIALLIDFIGYNLIWASIGVALSIMATMIHILAAGNVYFVPWLCSVLYSLAYSFYGTAMLVTIGYYVPENQTTTAYGISMSVLALLTTCSGYASGFIISYFGYLVVYIVYSAVWLINLILIGFLFLLEIIDGEKVLNLLGKSRIFD